MKKSSPLSLVLALAIPAIAAAQSQSPRLVTKTAPGCTAEANDARTAGTVVLGVTIDEKGMPTNIHVVRELDHGLSEKAIEAVEQWRFEPAIKDGQPVPVNATIEVNFRCPM